ncbi:OfeT family oxidase-dependent iron (Fe2+) transporter [Corynebacterium sp. HMSC036E10]|uniref:FTR1 family iron permease n=2 Tax=Corynebacteriaceae TaxID=1653 RepID=A0AAP6XKS6_9CORY|nr:FTR1 family iron permease [Corynebacterium coyleae]OHO83498.1 OfeT family oxidase-dependent iron (Fe2+) transporter [Corynebacterium sp. HMSC036E10]
MSASLLTRDTKTGSPTRLLLGMLFCVLLLIFSPMPAHADSSKWDSIADQMATQLEQVADQHEAGDAEAVQSTIRKAYYELYQATGLEDQIKHRLGTDRTEGFVSELLGLRTLSQQNASPEEIGQAAAAVIERLRTDVSELHETPELQDQWTRVAINITELVQTAQERYAQGDGDGAAEAAKDAYLSQYEANGLEKATISYIGHSRVTEVEALFQDLRQAGKQHSLSDAEYSELGDRLISAVTEDAAALDQLTSGDELGWRGFFASFLILLREGAEALLVIAAVTTYAIKANRRDQLKGIGLGVVAAVLISVALAVLFSFVASTATSGFGQELLEGIAGLLAVVMLIWVSNWVLTKASGEKWEAYVSQAAGEKTRTGGAFALAMVVFLAVLREGFETIMFYAPIIAGAKTGGDHVKIWLGVLAAVVILAILFLLVWKLGIRLPFQQFFKWTSILLGLLAITIAGGAIKEFQDATLVPIHRIDWVPEISFLGIYPTLETLAGQLIVVALLVALWLLATRKEKTTDAAVAAVDNTIERNDQ